MRIAPLRVVTVGVVATACGAMLVPPIATAAGAAPTITGVSPAVGRTTGGNYVTVAGANLGSVTRASFGSATSTKVRHISSTLIQVAAPRHGTGRVDLRVTGPGGTSKATSGDYYYFVLHSPHLSWTKPARVAGVGGDGLHGVSCVAANRCVLIDDHQHEFTWDGHVMSHRTFDPTSADDYDAVSCATTSFCMAVGSDEKVIGDPSTETVNAVAFVGSTSTGRVSIGQPGHSESGVSCASASMCVMVQDGGYATVYRDGHWGKPVRFSSTFRMYDQTLDCPSVTFCLATGLTSPRGPGIEASFDGHTWHTRTLRSPATLDVELGSLSCAQSTFCVGNTLNGLGEPFVRRGSTWGVGTTNGADVGGEGSISCPTVSFCVETTYATDDASNDASLAFDGAAASATPNPIAGGLISCPTDQLCMVAGGDTIALARRAA